MSTTRSIQTSLAIAALVLAACDAAPTAIYLVVDTNLEVSREVDALTIRVEPDHDQPIERDVDLTSAARPVRVRIDPRQGHEDASLRLVLSVGDGDTAVLTRTVRTAFVRGSVRELVVSLDRACLGVRCDAPDETCIAATCADDAIDARGLATWDGDEPEVEWSDASVPMHDAGERDAGAVDAGRDAGAPCPDAGVTDAGTAPTCGERACPTPRICAEGVPDAGPLCEPGPGEVRVLSAGPEHLCVIGQRTNGRRVLSCVGSDEHGQLGGAPLPYENRHPAEQGHVVVIDGLGDDPTAVAAGDTFTCAARDGEIRCWGEGAAGWGATPGCGARAELSVGTRTVTALDAGHGYACALADGRVMCWGNGDERGNPAVPRAGQPLEMFEEAPAFTGIVVGARHACAWTATGEAWCWGANERAQLGDGTTSASSPPVEVTVADGPVRAMAAGGAHTCALIGASAPHRVECWGSNSRGQLGVDPTNPAPVPNGVIVPLDLPATAIGAGLEHTCALPTNQYVSCWGNGDDGRAGVAPPRSAPVTPDEASVDAVVGAIAVADEHTCFHVTTSITCAGAGGTFRIPEDYWWAEVIGSLW
ncbi:RCC1 domain-containing protein [Sandaracinus amylolyticus]|uniref:BNR repeat domain protein n=1 Tax=Sandaracinus amylolyticus TaxID=927083 RepID=A0A0F6W378_9BACT|nr:hypothetical protein [Sandaracinus amylolyticus]AKF06273.1 BNR repeat domain protein [Sandaracinus amylolyticus]